MPLIVGNARVFEDQRPFPFVLKKKGTLFSIFSVRICDPLHEKCSQLIVKANEPVDSLWSTHWNAGCVSLFGKGVNNFLRKGLKEGSARTTAAGDDSAHRLRPCLPVVLFALRPIVHEQGQ